MYTYAQPQVFFHALQLLCLRTVSVGSKLRGPDPPGLRLQPPNLRPWKAVTPLRFPNPNRYEGAFTDLHPFFHARRRIFSNLSTSGPRLKDWELLVTMDIRPQARITVCDLGQLD